MSQQDHGPTPSAPGDKPDAVAPQDDAHYWGEGRNRVRWPSAQSAAELEWQCRYGKPDRSDLCRAAEILAAYHHMLTHPAPQRANLATLRRLERARRRARP